MFKMFAYGALLTVMTTSAFANPGHSHAHGDDGTTAYGRPGDPKKPARVIMVVMKDDMKFTPEKITIKQGEHIHFVVRNPGGIKHEMVLGTKEELSEHAELMKKFPDMEHDDPSALTLDAGKSGDMYWRFTKAGEFYFGCLVPGHLESGMIATVNVK